MGLGFLSRYRSGLISAWVDLSLGVGVGWPWVFGLPWVTGMENKEEKRNEERKKS